MKVKRLAVLAASAALAAGLSLPAAAPASGSAAPAAAPAGCTWHYNYYIQNDNQLGSYVQLWLTSAPCVSSYRAHLVCVYPRGGATATFYGVTVRPSAKSTARCNSSSEPDILYEDDNFTNGTHATYEDWHR